MRLLHPVLIRPLVRKALAKYACESSNQNIDKIIHLSDKCMSVNGNCNGSGTCIEICPVNNIILSDMHPQWQGRCKNCLACYNWCPSKAIDCELGEKGYYYRKNDINVFEIIKQSD